MLEGVIVGGGVCLNMGVGVLGVGARGVGVGVARGEWCMQVCGCASCVHERVGVGLNVGSRMLLGRC